MWSGICRPLHTSGDLQWRLFWSFTVALTLYTCSSVANYTNSDVSIYWRPECVCLVHQTHLSSDQLWWYMWRETLVLLLMNAIHVCPHALMLCGLVLLTRWYQFSLLLFSGRCFCSIAALSLRLLPLSSSSDKVWLLLISTKDLDLSMLKNLCIRAFWEWLYIYIQHACTS